jgi:hypothetical protein
MWRKYRDEQQEVGEIMLPGQYGFLGEMKPLCGQLATVTRDEDPCGQVIKLRFDDAEMERRFNHRQANYGFSSWMVTKIKGKA